MQTAGTAGTSGNCGVHMCVWAYIVCASKAIAFTEDDMNAARIAISHCLLASNIEATVHCTRRQMILESETSNREPRASHSYDIKHSTNPPMAFDSTIEYCAAIRILLDAEQ